MNELLDSYRGVRVLVLGASGFIGRWVSCWLTRAEANLHLTVRDLEIARLVFSSYQVEGRVHQLDLADFEQLLHLIEDVKPAVIFNLAGYGVDPAERDEKMAYLINSELPGMFCRYLVGNHDPNWRGQVVIHVGTAAEYGRAKGNLSEETKPEPMTLYGTSKLAGTRSMISGCQTSGIPGLTARLFTVYGPGEHPERLLPSLIRISESGENLPLTGGEQKRDFMMVEEAAEGLLRLGLSNHRNPEVVNLATGRLHAVRQFVMAAAQTLDVPANRLLFGSLPTRAEEMSHEPVRIQKLISLVGWHPEIDISEGISRTIQFNQEFGQVN
jgi:UDP-glucose 4-epimerase